MRVFRHYVSPVKVFVALLDTVLVSAAIILAAWVRFEGSAGNPVPLSPLALATYSLFPLIVVPIMIGFGTYESDSLRSTRVFFVRMILALAAASIVLFAVNFLFPSAVIWRSILVLAFAFAGAGLVLLRLIIGFWLSTRRFDRQAVLVGCGAHAPDILGKIDAMADGGISVKAIVPTESDSEATIEARASLTAIPIRRESLEDVIDDIEPELVLLAFDRSEEIPFDALLRSRLRGVRILSRLGFYEEICGYVPIGEIGPGWMIFSDGFRGRAVFERAGKRGLDLLIAGSLLIVLLPLMILSAVLVKLTSRGPVLYSQQRVGLGGQLFEVFKFRSMMADAEKATGATWASEKDPRVTGWGRFMRRTRIDELPQLVNILRGQMSFVGPRPERPIFVQQLEQQIPFYQVRHGVKPGLTGWAQIQFPYGASVEDAKRKLEYDLYYIKNYSLFLDILIILQTARVVLFSAGAR